MDENGGRVPPYALSRAGPDQSGGASGSHGLQPGANGQADGDPTRGYPVDPGCVTSPWRIAPSSLRKGLGWDHNPLITPCKDTFRPPRGTKRCELTLNITRFGHQTLFFRSLLVLTSLFALVQGNTPSPFEAGDEWWIVVLVFAVVGAICMVTGLALLRRHQAARRGLAISSWVLLLPSAAFYVPALVVAPSLWLTLSRGGKEALKSYMATENG